MKEGVLRNFTKFTGKHLCQSNSERLLLNVSVMAIPFEFTDIFENNYSVELLRTAAFIKFAFFFLKIVILKISGICPLKFFLLNCYSKYACQQ